MGVPIPQNADGIDRHVCMDRVGNGYIVSMSRVIPQSESLSVPGAFFSGFPRVIRGMRDAASEGDQSEFAQSLLPDDAHEVQKMSPEEAMKKVREKVREAEKNAPKAVEVKVFNSLEEAQACIQEFMKEE